VRLRCTNCDATFDGDPSERCPKCLRRTSVVEAPPEPAAPGAAPPAPWPDGPACPLCLTATATSATFVVELPNGATETADTAGKVATSTTVRCRCCDACRARVLGLERRRKIVLPIVMLAMLAWPVLSISELPRRDFHVEKLDAILYATLLTVLVVAMPLLVLDRASRALRKNLDASWLLRQLRARVRSQADAGPERPDEWRLLAEARSGAAVVDAPDLLR
jgi:hypothetical protein